MNKKESTTILNLAQLIIGADLLLHEYSKLTFEEKRNLIRKIEESKKVLGGKHEY